MLICEMHMYYSIRVGICRESRERFSSSPRRVSTWNVARTILWEVRTKPGRVRSTANQNKSVYCLYICAIYLCKILRRFDTQIADVFILVFTGRRPLRTAAASHAQSSGQASRGLGGLVGGTVRGTCRTLHSALGSQMVQLWVRQLWVREPSESLPKFKLRSVTSSTFSLNPLTNILW